MFCSHCGNELDDEAVICPKCGVPVPWRPPAAPVRASISDVKSHLIEAVLVTMFCCPIFGIPAIVHANRAEAKIAAGNVEGALSESRSALMWIRISLIVGAVLVFRFLVHVIEHELG